MAGRRALITGASLSIGRSLALGFADHGASVAVHYSAAADKAFGHPDAAQETVAALKARGVGTCLIEADLARVGTGREIVDTSDRRARRHRHPRRLCFDPIAHAVS